MIADTSTPRSTGLKPYSEYKDSGLPWLGRVPGHWGMRRTKVLLRERVEKGFPHESLLAATQSKGVVRKEDYGTRTVTAQKDFHLLKLVEVGDFVISLRSFEGGIEVAHSRGIISPAYTVLEPRSKATSGYLRHFFKSPTFISSLTLFVTGIREGQNIDYERLSRAFLPLPPDEEQAAIVRFLDHATYRLDKAIRAKRKTIALLNEQKQAIIHRAVTRGLDPDVPLKDSGIPWLGQIPAHWEVMPLKRTCSLVRDGTHLPPARTLTGYPLLSVRNMVGGRLVRRADDSFISKADFEQLNSSFVVRPNDVLMAIVGATLGKVAVVDDIGPFQIQRSVSILRPRFELMSHAFLATFLRSPRLQQYLWQSVAFSAQPGIYLGFVANIPVPVPPTIAEQVSICDSLQRELSPIDTAISRIEREIELLREYRTRLIADVVTGKLDVREAAAKLPEEPAPDVADMSDEIESVDEEATV